MPARRLSLKGMLWILSIPAILGQLCSDAAGAQGPSAAASATPGERLAEYVRRLDANRNGRLERGEVPAQARSMLEHTAGEAGLDRSRPLPVDKLAEALKHRYGRPAAAGPAPTASPQTLRPAVGFGLGKGVPPRESPPPAAAGEAGERFSRYATLLLRKYDANGDGVLQQDEWAVMPGNPRSLDRDGDALVTAEELAGRLTSARSRRPVAAPVAPPDTRTATAGPPAAGTEIASTVSRSPSPSTRPASSALPQTPIRHSRTVVSQKVVHTDARSRHLPAGLPDWFLEKDANNDGQVKMHEYADHWTDSKAAEFETYDPDGDGIITPKECLRTEENKHQQEPL